MEICSNISKTAHPSMWQELFSFLKPNPKEDELQRVEQDLSRLIETAPHLLADIGFTRDPNRSNAMRTVYVSPHGDVEILHDDVTSAIG